MTLQTPSQHSEVLIERLSHDGRGIARVSGKTVFVEGALPGETVTLAYRHRKNQFDEATTQAILIASPSRQTPFCEKFGMCGGCSLQHLAPLEQVSHKQAVLLEKLKHIAGVTPKIVLPWITGPEQGYRRRTRLGVQTTASKKVSVGFREKQGNLLVDLETCPVLSPSLSTLLPAIKALLIDLNKNIFEIEMAAADNAIGLTFHHHTPFTADALKKITDFAKENSVWIYSQLKHCKPEKIWPNDEQSLIYRLAAFDLTFHFTPTDFIQTNAAVNKKMVALAINLLAPVPQDKILDLFSGLGNFSLPLAKVAQHVVGLEGDASLVQKANHLAARNGLSEKAAFYSADLTRDFKSPIFSQGNFTKILLDPPRMGAAALMPVIGRLKARTIVYVSCDPATFARDAGLLVKDHGYSLEKVGVLDMFPHTTHVESIALFRK